jgi:3-oxoacyl-[acyl-carrier protein] reductase
MSRSALVTGASRGIGRGIALGLAADGVDLIGVHYRVDSAAALQTAKELESRGADVVLLQADLREDAAGSTRRLAGAFLDAVEERTGARVFDILVNNVGGAEPRSLPDLDEATYRREIDLNLTAPLFLLQALVPHIASQGRVVNISTGFTKVAAPDHLVYAAAKAALNYLTLGLAPVLGERGATINAVLPGVIETERTAAGLLSQEAGRAFAVGLSVFHRVGTVEDVVSLVRYLVSPAAGWTTGQCLDVSGGSRL